MKNSMPKSFLRLLHLCLIITRDQHLNLWVISWQSRSSTIFGLKQICKGLFLSYASVRKGKTVTWVILRLFKLN